MTGTLAVLVIDITEPQHLADVFGVDATSQALVDIGAQFDALVTRLLVQHEILSYMQQGIPGRWSALFRIRNGSLPRNMQETCTTIEKAGCKLLRDMLISVLGTGTAMRVPTVLAVFPLSSVQATDNNLELWLDKQLATRPAATQTDVADAAEMTSIIAEQSIRTLLQPIVRLENRTVVGYEALARGPRGSILERADRLFDTAHDNGCHVELELLCARLALERTRGKLPADCFLTINLGPEALTHAADMLPLAGRTEVLLELTEHLPLDKLDKLTGVMARLRTLGIGLALDDTGCGFADLDAVRILQPEIVKLCITVIRNADQGSTFSSAITETAQHLLQLDCRVLAEGVETETQHAALTSCHIELAQGFLYGKPETAARILSEAARQRTSELYSDSGRLWQEQ